MYKIVKRTVLLLFSYLYYLFNQCLIWARLRGSDHQTTNPKSKIPIRITSNRIVNQVRKQQPLCRPAGETTSPRSKIPMRVVSHRNVFNEVRKKSHFTVQRAKRPAHEQKFRYEWYLTEILSLRCENKSHCATQRVKRPTPDQIPYYK